MAKESILGNTSRNTIPLDMQREYMHYHHLVDSQELPETVVLNESKKLFLKKVGWEEKKRPLYLLAHTGNAKAYQVLQRYQKKTDQRLQAWAELCLQECAGRCKAELLGQVETFIVMSGAGGDCQRLGYYFIFSSEKSRSFTAVQKRIMKESAKLADKHLGGKTEKMWFGKIHVVCSALLPMDIAAEMYFQEIYRAVNKKNKVLRYHYYCNNIQKPISKNIEKYLKSLK